MGGGFGVPVVGRTGADFAAWSGESSYGGSGMSCLWVCLVLDGFLFSFLFFFFLQNWEAPDLT